MYEASKESGAVSSIFSKIISDPSGSVLRGLRDQLSEAMGVAEGEALSNPSKLSEIEDVKVIFRAAQDVLDRAEIEARKVRGGL